MANGNTAKTSSSSSVEVSRSGPAPAEQGPAPVAPDVPQAQQAPQAPLPAMPKNELMAALSSGFAKAAVGHFGRAAAELLDDPSVAGYYDEIGTDVKQALHDRWNQRDFENFQTQELKPMTEDLQKLEESRRAQFNALNKGQVIDPETGEVIGEIDPTSIEAVQLKQNMERNMMGAFTQRTTKMMEAAQRHGSNPLVDAFMAQYMTNASTTINGIVSPMTKGIGPAEKADIDYKKAMTRQAQETARFRQAQTKDIATKAEDLNNMSDIRIFNEVANGDAIEFLDLMESHPVGRERMERYRQSVSTEMFNTYMKKNKLSAEIPDELARGERWLAEPTQQDKIREGGRIEILRSQPGLLKAIQQKQDPRVQELLDTTPADTRIATPLTSREVTEAVKDSAWPWMQNKITEEITNNPNVTLSELTDHAITELADEYIRLAFVPGSTNTKQKRQIRTRLERLIRNERPALQRRLKSKTQRVTEGVVSDVGAALDPTIGALWRGGKSILAGIGGPDDTGRERRKRTILEGK